MYDGHEYVRENVLNDTLYKINHDYSFTPKYIINAGKREVPIGLRSDSRLFERESENYVIVNQMFETKDYMLLNYTYQSKRVTCYFHKDDNKLIYFPSPSGIPNDYDGGFDFWPVEQINKEMYAIYNAYLFEEHKKNNNRVAPKGPPEAIERFNQLTGQIDPEDNPVLVIVRMK